MNGKELKNLRNKLGLTQKQMGEKIGVTRDAIAKYESGGNMRKSVSILADQLSNAK